jgi:hypothetical protein
LARLVGILAVGFAIIFFAWFDFSEAGLASWLAPQVVLSLAGLTIGFIILSWQLQRQHRNTLEANRRQSQDRLKVELYHEIARRIEATAALLTDSSLTPTGFVGHVMIFRDKPARSRYTFSKLQTIRQRLSSSVLGLTSTLEVYEIVMPQFKILRQRAGEAFSLATAAFGDFSLLAAHFVGADGTAPAARPTDDELRELSRLAETAQVAGIALTAVVHDLRVEAQNHLLGSIFTNRAPRRAPSDPSVQVTILEEQLDDTTSGGSERFKVNPERGFRRLLVVVSLIVLVAGAGFDALVSSSRLGTGNLRVTLLDGRNVQLEGVPLSEVPVHVSQNVIDQLANERATTRSFDLRQKGSEARDAVKKYGDIASRISALPGFEARAESSAPPGFLADSVQWSDIRRIEILTPGKLSAWWASLRATRAAVGIVLGIWIAFFTVRWVIRGFASQ